MKLENYKRKPFIVQCVQVTADNMEEVAKWVGGSVKHESASANRPAASYVEVSVIRPTHPKQSMAYIGNWVLKMGTTWKVYTDTGFRSSFEPLTS